MAKVVITVDTETATLSASVNGKEVDNVKSVSVYKFVDSYTKNKTPEVDVSISSFTEEEDGVRKSMHICCEHSTAGKTAVSLGGAKAEFEGFVTNPVGESLSGNDYSCAGKAVRDGLMKRFANGG